jgi:nicotinamidase-related amidase
MDTMKRNALVLVDIQNDFLPPTGALAVAGGKEIIPIVLDLLKEVKRFDLIVATRVRPEARSPSLSVHYSRPYPGL